MGVFRGSCRAPVAFPICCSPAGPNVTPPPSAPHRAQRLPNTDFTVSRRVLISAACIIPALSSHQIAWADEDEPEIKLPLPGVNPYNSRRLSIVSYFHTVKQQVIFVMSCALPAGVLKLPGDFLRARQRVNGGEKILAPIRAAQIKLKEAQSVLMKCNIYDPNPRLYRDALRLVRQSSLNCYGFEALEGDSLETRASLLQRKVGIADACTFRLIAKNVTGLLPLSKEKLKQGTSMALNDLISSYEMLDSALLRAWTDGAADSVESVPHILQVTQDHIISFQTMIERCLDLPPSNVAPSAISTMSIDRLKQLWNLAYPWGDNSDADDAPERSLS